ncbi:CaiF/GrlA family transcriptional regulator [Citrobacter amalonaticus]|uniref:CaiF/GrlA family transcriptional regulator n=1 Tax=Citrobacter amalonaticus TaxID=35703 RepID=A0A2S4RXS1_CITAM|nr:CaiF/GrlA family transcriptional regulator [Citrobacter amalonaticus]POT56157.1 CaiF/GrlA family transcriptional regulator [Citrobacter amalonaticus]POT74466.1 CaiF/GrlA family transcriptional regulator [Citrobacter amalonaticus]POU65265.1 CaiF/GrlA family transcriptional regulator [Citrobacter amalonaticus]POV04100.1 CaiF/GrlA family transcriptional regulator [Citrobacter amalonaticus]
MNTLQTVGTVRGGQSNHGDFYMPAEIRHLGGMPLYRAVAWWGLLTGKAFSREQVCQAFRVDQRRASGVLNYLCHRYHHDDITFESYSRHLPGGHRQLTIRILAVKESAKRPASPTPSTPRRRSIPTGDNADRLMARWLLSRPSGNDEARLAAWKAACPVPEDAL